MLGSRLQSKAAEQLRRSQQNLADLQQHLLADSQLFEDDDFPADWSSLSPELRDMLPEPGLLQWKRPKEICADPRFVSDGASRFDVRQGTLGDCWLLAAVASLSLEQQLLNRVVPQPQPEFGDSSYRGLFRFRFWQFGQWTEVVVDDRLPTYDNQLVFMHSTDSSEFWSALLEKAYAKVVGSYGALKGGSTSEAMEDFTGGITEFYSLRGGQQQQQQQQQLYDVMLRACKRSSLMGCAIDADPGQIEAQLPNGLIMGHAYSVTDVQTVDLVSGSRQHLVRVRNPWGNEAEWQGAWSDASASWSQLSDSERRRLHATAAADGEFWMSFDDFASNFDKLEVCSLGPDSATGGDGERHRWEATQHNGRWLRGVSAGGCRKFLATFASNPQYRLAVVDSDEADGQEAGTVLLGLMQKFRRRIGGANRHIGYMLYRLDTDWPPGPLPTEFFKVTASAARSPAFADTREVTGRHRLPPGNYVLVPSTFDPNQEAEFLLRVYTETPVRSEECDELPAMPQEGEAEAADAGGTAAADPQSSPPPSAAQNRRLQEKAAAAFSVLQADQPGLDADDLRQLVNAAFVKIGPQGFGGFSKEAGRSLLAFVDVDQSGTVQLPELLTLWRFLRLLCAVFRAFDADGSGSFSSFELRSALASIGYRVPNSVHRSLVLRYADGDGCVAFDDFVIICVRLRTVFEELRARAAAGRRLEYSLDEFLQVAAYT